MKPLRLLELARASRPQLWGHRGSRSGLPENTLAAIAAAGAAGADGVEVDVRRCRSGELVVIHDATLARVTHGADPRRVRELTWRELRRTDLGQGQRVPCLDEVLEHCRRQRLTLNVELKGDDTDRGALARCAARTLRRHDITHPVVLSSFHPSVVARVRAAAPGLPVALLVEGAARLAYWTALALAFGSHAIHPEARAVTPRRVQVWHRLGLRVHAWTVNDGVEARRLITAGVDALITDLPAALRHCVVPALP